MLKNKILCVTGILFSIVALIFSLIFFPVFMGGYAIFCVIGAALCILGLVLALINISINNGRLNLAKLIVLFTGLGTFVLTLLIIGCVALANNLADKQTVVSEVSDPTDVVTQEPVVTTAPEEFSLYKPADVEDVDQEVWNKPYEDGVMVTGEGLVYYAQTGKDDAKLIKGNVPDGQALVIDAFALSKTFNGKTESMSGGCILVVVGPLDLDANPINITDGAAQTIGIDSLQNLLDTNIAVKFARGNRLADNSAWSYQPWALENSNIVLPDGYKFNKLTLTEKTDTYPSK